MDFIRQFRVDIGLIGISSVEGDGLAHVSARFQPKSEAQEKKEEEEEEEEESKEQKQDEFHEPPASPVKTVPGAF